MKIQNNKERYLASATMLLCCVIGGVALSPARAQTNGNLAEAAQADTAPELSVRVNGSPVSFIGQQPVEQDGHLLVPLRGVLEKLGAYVEFDDNSQTVFAVRGNTRVTLPIGQSVATVNNQPVTLDVPAKVVNGSTLVPLRFMAEAFGAKVTFDIGSNTVAIVTPDIHPVPRRDPHPPRPVAARTAGVLPSGESTILGSVEAVYSDLRPTRLVVKVAPDGAVPGIGAGSEQTITLRPDAAFTEERPNGPQERISLERLEIGDRVAVLREPGGVAEAVNLLAPGPAPHRTPVAGNPEPVFKGSFFQAYREDKGLVRLRMLDGRTIEMPQSAPVLLGGDRIALSDLRPGDNVSIAVDPRSRLGTRVLVSFRQ